MAPVLYTGNLHSALIDTLDKIQGPEIAFTFLDAMLYFREIYITHAAQYLVKYFPRLSWWVCSCFGGFGENINVEISRIPMMANNDIGGTSTKNMMHWSQMIRTGTVAQYDYGPAGNLLQYRQLNPPKYEVNTLTERLSEVPITLFSGDKDVLAPPSHVKRLIELLPKNDIENVDAEFHTPYVNLIQIHDYNHLDLIWGAK